jgi:hypothetical protein
MNDITLTFSGPCDETGKIQLPKYAGCDILPRHLDGGNTGSFVRPEKL